MKHRGQSILVITIILAGVLLILNGLSIRAEDPLFSQRQSPVNEDQFPIVEESDPEPQDPQERARRKAKGLKFHRDVELKSNPNSTIVARVKHWPADFRSLPVDESSTVIVGQVVAAKAFVSTDRTAVYSEFTITPQQVLKDFSVPVAPKARIIITRFGGRVRFRDGGVQLLYNTGQGMPRVGGQYLLFLNRDGEDFELVTGYELSTGRVVPLDSGTPNFDAHRNQEATAFVNLVREKIVGPCTRTMLLPTLLIQAAVTTGNVCSVTRAAVNGMSLSALAIRRL